MRSKNPEDQKIYRWSFEAVVTEKDQKPRTFPVNAVTLGSRKDGREAAARVEEVLKKTMDADGFEVRVRPVMHERISYETIVELNRNAVQAQTYKIVAHRLAENLKFATADLRPVDAIVTEEIKKLSNSHAEPVTEGPELVVSNLNDETESQPKRRLGIDAFNDIMAKPAGNENSEGAD